MEHRPVVIIGAGPAGLTAAYVLSKAGVRSIVLEKDQIGRGACKNGQLQGLLFRYRGTSVFHQGQNPLKISGRKCSGEELLRRNRLSRIYYNKKFFYYPLRPLNALLGLGGWNSLRILFSYLTAQLFPSKEEKTFEHWVSNRFGKTSLQNLLQGLYGESLGDILR